MRTFCALFLLALLSQAQATPLPELILSGPPTTVSYPLLRMLEDGSLTQQAQQIRFQTWQNPDQMRALVSNEQVHISAVPTNVAALLYNKGLAVKLLNVSVWGMLWLVSHEPNLNHLSQINTPVLLPFKGDMPDLLLRLLAQQQQLSLQLEYAASPINAAQLLLAGKAQHALLPEPMASAVILKSQATPQPLYAALSVRQLWQQGTGLDLPQAGLMSTALLANQPELRQTIAHAYQQASLWCQSHITACAALAERHLGTPAETAAAALRSNPLNVQDIRQSQTALQGFFQRLSELDIAKLGGKLPPPEFYLP